MPITIFAFHVYELIKINYPGNKNSYNKENLRTRWLHW